ncbi:hemerythrin [Paractinoplanes rishiriensis]|uniref:Hemerythrin n=2 Tax=Paractinoplanes rishiriensis TaxID=1050105 RepID=A0A919K9P5_9ACTN|nr:hemerythrin [Actinoplanes rishiriensis]
MEAFQVTVFPDIVDVLRHEHEQIRRLCTAVREAGRDRKKRPLAALLQAVHLHQLGETAVAHPAARNSSRNGDIIARTCQSEGAGLERSLTELSRLGVRHPGFDAGFANLSGAMLDHAADQERDEFPLLRRHVPAQRLHMMASAMQDIQIMART